MSASPWTRPLLGLFILAALLLALAGYAPLGAPPPPAEVAAPPPRILPPLSALAQTRDRPLFAAGRLPPPPPQSPAGPARPLLFGGYEVVAAVEAGASRILLIRPPEGDKVLRLAPGAVLDGWRLDEVSASHVRFSRGAEILDLDLNAPVPEP